ncbi:DUF3084 domain-containing protein [Deinococcus psychrotolerans]|uniref:DUF3084 domain-containing protein n=1 Tax=Deinococcus psychrotolerans TaxID=2489213 RepID=A0A3G8YC97_9DEIO|nr:DUF3084 domain-containing protein [Deinococcus psychrotolerans]AZI41827.1 DUF3084 domain-containing protein [Deinococcus psychrotolerans]
MLLGFLIFVVLLSGLVAYSADTIARKAGRKHLRLFGLRPKTTALIVAVASGMGISLASVLAFGLINRSAINNIVQADKLRVELKQLKKDVSATTADLTVAEQERDAANARVRQSKGETAAALADLTGAEDKLKTTQAARTKLQSEVSGLQGRVTELANLKRDLEAQAAKNRQALSNSQRALEGSRQRELAQAARANLLGTQIVDLDRRSASAQQDAKTAQAQAEAFQGQVQALQDQTKTLEASRAKVGAQLQAAQQSRDQATRELGALREERQTLLVGRDAALSQRNVANALRDQANVERNKATAERNKAAAERDLANQARTAATKTLNQALSARDSALQARDLAQAQRESLAAERDQLLKQRSNLTAQRDAAAQDLSSIRRELSTLQNMIGTLDSQRQNLSAANDTLKNSLSSAQANLSKLEVDYSRTNSELSANRNTDLIYSRNDLVYAGVVASVRNVPDFLKAAATAAQKQGARGMPAARLSPDARAQLDTKLRGLNTNTFVQCRAAVNVATGFPVDLNCDAKPQTVLFRRGQVIRQVSINLQRGTDNLSSQLTDLIRDTVFDLTSKGVPLEYINDLGLSDSERLDVLGKLGAQSGASAVVGLAARDDIRPGVPVDLYPVLK